MNKIQEILSNYQGENAGVRANLYRILMHGKLSGTGKMVILPVDQGMEHGPDRSFVSNPAAYDPHYHFQLAIDAGLNAFAAPIGMLEDGAHKFAGQIPLILKMNSSNSLKPNASFADQAITSSIDDALRLGCVAIGFTIYPASGACFEMIEEITYLANEAKKAGLAVVIWSYPRGEDLSKKGETAVDVCAYAAHLAALIGAHIIKIKPPKEFVEQEAVKQIYEQNNIELSTLKSRIEHVRKACFNGKRLVVFSGGEASDKNSLLEMAAAIRDGGGNGSIIGRNSFQRPRNEALDLLSEIIKIYKEEN